jgi:purine-binding chemotaxis protein CheW
VDVVVARLGERTLAIPAARVREVAAVSTVTPVPTAPAEVAGLMQLRGQIVPVLELDRAGVRAPRPGDPLLVLELGPVRAALRVDRVLGVESDPAHAEPLDLGALIERVRAQPAGP